MSLQSLPALLVPPRHQQFSWDFPFWDGVEDGEKLWREFGVKP